MKNIVRVLAFAVAVSAAGIMARQYTKVTKVESFDTHIKKNKYVVVFFYEFDKSLTGKAKKELTKETRSYLKVFDEVGDNDMFEDRKNMKFLSVNASTDYGRKLFNRYALQECPGYILIKDGKEVKPTFGLTGTYLMYDNNKSQEQNQELLTNFINNHMKFDK